MSTSKTQNPKNVLHPSRRPTPIQSYCPNHSDSRHTLTITLGPDAAILFHCVAGCTITSILTALKETYGVLFPYPLNELTSYDPDPARAKSIANALLWTAAQILMDDAYLALQSTRAITTLSLPANPLPQSKPLPEALLREPSGRGSVPPYTTNPLSDYDNTDIGNAQRLHHLLSNRAIYVPELDKWFLWLGNYWCEDTQFALMALAKLTVLKMRAELDYLPTGQPHQEFRLWLQRSATHPRLQAMINLVRSEPGITIPLHRLDQQPYHLSCRNGTINLRTGQLAFPTPAHYLTKCLDLDYNPAVPCPLWLAFLHRIMAGNLELIAYLQRLIGHALTGDPTGKYFVFLWGPGGNNGKSTLVEIILRLLGPYALKSPTSMLLPRNSRTAPTNDIARLRGIRFTVTNEVDDDITLSDTLIKDLTGRDTLIARHLHHDFFTFIPTHKLWIYGNHRPQIRNPDPALAERVHLLPFQVTIPPEERDPHLLDKLTLELPGILAWAVQGCLEWQRIGIQPPSTVIAASAQYRLDQDTLADFLADCFLLDPTARTSCRDLYTLYLAWCQDTATPPYTAAKLGKELEKRGFPQIRQSGHRHRTGLRPLTTLSQFRPLSI